MDMEKTCPKCEGMMEPGELVDKNYATSDAQEWAEQAGSFLGFGLSGRIRIISYRCIECGFIENYAPSEERREKVKSRIEEMEKEKKKRLAPKPPNDNENDRGRIRRSNLKW